MFIIRLSFVNPFNGDVLLHGRRRSRGWASRAGVHGVGLRPAAKDGVLRRREPRVRPPNTFEIEDAGFEHKKICVEDFTAPTLDQVDEFVAFVDSKIAEGKKVL